jgi:hypothetical protein
MKAAEAASAAFIVSFWPKQRGTVVKSVTDDAATQNPAWATFFIARQGGPKFGKIPRSSLEGRQHVFHIKLKT